MSEQSAVSIGFRAETKSVFWAIVSGSRDEPCIEAMDELRAPVTFDEAQRLAFFAKEVGTLCDRYKPHAAFVREAEAVAQTKRALVAARARIEGATIAVLASRGIAVRLGPLATIAAKLKPGSNAKWAKELLESDEFRGIDLAELDSKQREAVLVAIVGLK